MSETTRYELKSYEAHDRRMAAFAEVGRRATADLRPAQASLLGAIGIAPRLAEDIEMTQPQFRTGPLPVLDGGELRFHHLHGGEDPVDDLVDWLRAGVETFCTNPEQAAGHVAKARAVTLETIGKDGTTYPAMTLSSIGYYVGRHHDRLPFDVVVEIEMLGASLEPIIERIIAASPDRLEVGLAEALATHRARARLRGQFRADRSRGFAEETTLRVLEAAGMHLDLALERIAERGELVFDFDEGTYKAEITWHDGVLEASLSTNEPGLDLRNGWLRVAKQVPETLLAGSIGRRLGCLVEHRYLPKDSIIMHACSDHDGSALVSLAIPRRPIPSAVH